MNQNNNYNYDPMTGQPVQNGYQFQQFNNNVKKTNQNKSTNNKKIILIIIGIFLLILIIALVIWFVNNNKNNNEINNYSNISKKEEISYNYSDEEIPKFIDGTFSSITINSSSDVIKALEEIKDEMKIKDVSNEFKFLGQETNEDITYYKFSQVYNNVLVYNQNIIVIVDSQGKIIGLSGYYIPEININVNPKLNKAEAEKIVKTKLGNNANITSNELYVWANKESQTLIYVISGYSNTLAQEYIINANSGEILDEVDIFDYSTNYEYIGKGLDNRNYKINLEKVNDTSDKYNFYDIARKISIADYRNIGPYMGLVTSAFPGSNSITVNIVNKQIDMINEDESFIQSAITAMADFEKIYDYYKDELGRNSYDNKGSAIIVNLGVNASTFSNNDLNNAMWNTVTNQMFIGNYNGKSFSASLDVMGHEFTHGVIDFTAHFARTAKRSDKNKAFETGALDEGYADVLGSLIEGKNWTIAENNVILRDTSNPKAYKNPSVKGGEYYFPDGYLNDTRTLEQFLKDNNLKYVTEYDKGGVHVNSNVVSHAAYLMYFAGAFSSREEMARVWYNSLLMLSSYANFEDCALAVIKSAQNLGLSDSSIYKITKTFQDTKMLDDNNNYSLSGEVVSGKEKIEDATIEIYSYEDDSLITSTITDENGLYEIQIPTGTYNVKVSKKDFEEFTTTITIKGETTLNVELSHIQKKNTKVGNCKGENCVKLTIYFLASNNSENLAENSETYTYKKGTVIGANLIVDSINNALKQNILSTDGSSFYMSVGGFKMDFSWYYKDTDKIFDFNKPLNEDTEIEMKMYNGLFDNNLLTDIDSMLKKQ